MAQSDLGNHLHIRPAALGDVPHINTLFLVRHDQIVPGDQSWKSGHRASFVSDGEAFFGEGITTAGDNPQSEFFHVATMGGAVVGYARASAESEPGYAELRGIVVSEAYELQGVAKRLEEARQRWAAGVGRILRGHIIQENTRSLGFLRAHGYHVIAENVKQRAFPDTLFTLVEQQSPQL